MSDLIAAVVARGVILQPGRDANGALHCATQWIEYGPGSTVMLPADEVARLQQIGALASPPVSHRRTIPT
jgi:hypothetical protein